MKISQQRLDFEIKVREARDDLIKFTELTMPDYTSDSPLQTTYEAGIHHKAIAEALQKVESGEILRLIITMPPRHGKSELGSRRFPAWFVGRDKTRQVIFATYSETFAQDFGRSARDIITSDVYQKIFRGVQPKTETRSAGRMELVRGGLMVFTGVGGAITGRGADLLLIDDPFKNREEAESRTVRDKRWDWFTSTAYTRLMPGGRVVIIMTRWDEDDIVGRLLSTDYMTQEQIDNWTVLNLPAIAHENTKNEAALWPKKYPLYVLHEIRSVLGSRDWNALYQQKPTPPEGAFFRRAAIEKNLYSINQLPRNLTKYTAFDLAVSKEKKKRDATCCLTAGLDDDDVLWILPDIYWERRAADESVEAIADQLIIHDPMAIYSEKGQLDKAIGPFLEKYLNERKIYKFFEKLPSTVNKGARATSIRGRIQHNKVKFPKDATWWPAAFDQLLKFTGSGQDKEDDFVDALSLLGQGLQRQYYGGDTVEEAKQESDNGNVRMTLDWIKKDSEYRKSMNAMKNRNSGW